MKKSPSRCAYCLDHGGVAVARRRDGNPGHEVQVAVAIDIFERGMSPRQNAGITAFKVRPVACAVRSTASLMIDIITRASVTPVISLSAIQSDAWACAFSTPIDAARCSLKSSRIP